MCRCWLQFYHHRHIYLGNTFISYWSFGPVCAIGSIKTWSILALLWLFISMHKSTFVFIPLFVIEFSKCMIESTQPGIGKISTRREWLAQSAVDWHLYHHKVLQWRFRFFLVSFYWEGQVFLEVGGSGRWSWEPSSLRKCDTMSTLK